MRRDGRVEVRDPSCARRVRLRHPEAARRSQSASQLSVAAEPSLARVIGTHASIVGRMHHERPQRRSVLGT